MISHCLASRRPLPRLAAIHAAHERALWRDLERAWRADLDARLRAWLAALGDMPTQRLHPERTWRA